MGTLKSQKDCKCARNGCVNNGAVFFHKMLLEYYCSCCANIIQEKHAIEAKMMYSDGLLLVEN